MSEANPLELVSDIGATLRAYLPTTLPISRRYPELSKEFRRLLANEPLVKGPFVEALADFDKGRSLAQLLLRNGGFLHDGLSDLPESWLKRKLHLHQDLAIEEACRRGSNMVVATGTGSGKTECFLLPLADMLLQADRRSPGVRCLLVYPMNALANDQIYYRIAPLFGRYLRDSGVTFGRFTGQIRANTDRREEEQRLRGNEKLMTALGNPGQIPRNWLLTREEMLASPPDVLITNYAMLEHLLLLPRNAPLFAENHLKALVLDEVHTYGGSQATEIAFLLRKLKHRLKVRDPIQCFATSASLPSSEEAASEVIRFASDLFGEPFTQVVHGRRVSHRRLAEPSAGGFTLDAEAWERVGRALSKVAGEDSGDERQWGDFLGYLEGDLELGIRDESLPMGPALLDAFSANREIRGTAALLDRGGVVQFESLRDEIFPAGEDGLRSKALAAVLRVGMMARAGAGEFPLLPGRYHIAVNTLEGVCVLLGQGRGESWRAIAPFRAFEDERGVFYPMLVCRKCGQPYVEGYEHDNRLWNRLPANARGNTRRVFWLGPPPSIRTNDEEDDEQVVQEESGGSGEAPDICVDPKTGAIVAQGDASVSLWEIPAKEDEDLQARFVMRCPACGGSTGTTDAEVLTKLHPGNEALASVVTQKVLEALPPVAGSSRPVPFGGRALLTFSDNRQNAAFFAPYLERTSRDLAVRTALYQVLRESGDEFLDLETAGDRILRRWRRQGTPVMLDSGGRMVTDRVRIMDLLTGAMGVEFCTPGSRRTSLEALGLAEVTYDRTVLRRLTRQCADLPGGLDEAELADLLHFLLESIRREKAITNFWDVDMRDEFIWGMYSWTRAFELFKQDSRVRYAWLPQEGSSTKNRRTWYLEDQLGLDKQSARDFLAGFWEACLDTKILLPASPGFAMDARKIRVGAGEQRPVHVCVTCGLRQRRPVRGRCVAFRCRSSVSTLSAADREIEKDTNHYIRTYEAGVSSTLRAREHTASLSTEIRERIEREFAEGEVNVLSCTTTMEMGVDLGDLEAVVNLNVPPGIANYQQRTGRAGRRAQAAPFCVTIARTSPYDQAVFASLEEYLARSSPVPYFRLDNPTLFRRHQVAVVLSRYLRHRIKNLEVNAPSLSNLLGEEFGDLQFKAFSDDLAAWFEGEDGLAAIAEGAGLADTLPEGLRHRVALGQERLRVHFVEQLEGFAMDARERWNMYTRKWLEADALADAKKKSWGLRHWDNLRRQFMGQFLVNQLSTRGLIPTYSFPVHSLTLDVISEKGTGPMPGSASDVSLGRDAVLGISEYAPGANVVANGRVWESAGLVKYPRMFMPEEWYCACLECHHVDIAPAFEDVPLQCSNCNSGSRRLNRRFVEPKGFVTAYRERNGRDPGMVRRRERPADEARLIALPTDDLFQGCDQPGVKLALLPAQSAEEGPLGELVILNRGPKGYGYHVCGLCNYAVPAKNNQGLRVEHDQPLSGEPCGSEQLPPPIDLAHRFATDVLVLRFFDPLPPVPADMQPVQFLDALSRTVTEAIRYGAADCLEVDGGELRSTFRRNGARLDVILYDAVAGGAGYCKRLAEVTSMDAVLKAATRKLQCAKDCSNACTACLCDYSNQRIWDLLDRHPARQWLLDLLARRLPGPFDSVGAAIWESPSLRAAADAVAGAGQVNLLAPRLGLADDVDERHRKWLTGLMESGIQVSVYVSRHHEGNHHLRNTEARRALRHLYPYLESGRLKVLRCPEGEGDPWSSLPRFWVPGDRGAVFFSGATGTSLLGNPLPEPVFRAMMDGRINDLTSVLSRAEEIPLRNFQAWMPLQRWELSARQDARFETVFGHLRGAYLQSVNIKDPYCGTSEQNRSSLKQFLAELLGIVEKLEQVSVTAREVAERDDRWEPFNVVHERLRDALAGLPVSIDIEVRQFRKARQFHDRTVDVLVIDDAGCSSRYRYDLTGGIDHLMSKGRDTKVYRYVE